MTCELSHAAPVCGTHRTSLKPRQDGGLEHQQQDARPQAPLLHTRTRPGAWQDWAKATGQPLPAVAGQSFEHFYFSLQAAVAGLGVALGLASGARRTRQRLAGCPMRLCRGRLALLSGVAKSIAREQPTVVIAGMAQAAGLTRPVRKCRDTSLKTALAATWSTPQNSRQREKEWNRQSAGAA